MAAVASSPAAKGLFGKLAPIYAMFFGFQRRSHARALDLADNVIGLSQYKTVLDVGCGTGALCAAWQGRGFAAKGIDREARMVDVARRKTLGLGIDFRVADVLRGLPFADESFDIVIASHVAHGLKTDARHVMYREMQRVAGHLVILHDFNKVRSGALDFIEALEGSDYLKFIEAVQDEMLSHFEQVDLLEVGPRTTWYIGRK